MLLVVVDDDIVGVDADADVEIEIDVEVDIVDLAWDVVGVQTKEAKWSEPVVDRNHNQVVVEEVLWSVPFGDCPTQLKNWKNTTEESYQTPAPEVSPPPWIHTRTGRACWGWVE